MYRNFQISLLSGVFGEFRGILGLKYALPYSPKLYPLLLLKRCTGLKYTVCDLVRLTKFQVTQHFFRYKYLQTAF